MRATRVLVVGLSVLVLSVAGAISAEYIGAAKCKMCHKVQYQSWESLPHAKAFDRLKPEEQTDAECLKCHATGGKAELPGVQCESCHGPGSDYKSVKIMKDRDASVAAGLLIPDEATCTSCHNEESPTFQGFNYEEALKTGVHEISG